MIIAMQFQSSQSQKLVSFSYHAMQKWMDFSPLPRQVNAIDPLTPTCDEHVSSPYNIDTLSHKQVITIHKLIRQKMLS